MYHFSCFGRDEEKNLHITIFQTDALKQIVFFFFFLFLFEEEEKEENFWYASDEGTMIGDLFKLQLFSFSCINIKGICKPREKKNGMNLQLFKRSVWYGYTRKKYINR